MSETGWKVRTTIASLLIPPAIQLLSLASLTSMLTRWSARPASGPSPEPDSTAWRVDRVLHSLPWPWRHTCLRRATTLYYLLRLSGHPVHLQVGVRKEKGGTLEAHAWITLRGDTILEAPSAQISTFSPIATFGG